MEVANTSTAMSIDHHKSERRRRIEQEHDEQEQEHEEQEQDHEEEDLKKIMPSQPRRSYQGD